MKRSAPIVTVVRAVSIAFLGLCGHLLYAAESLPQALIDFHAEQEAQIAQAPPAVQERIEAAKQLSQQGRYAEAADAYQQVAAISDKDPDPLVKPWVQLQAGICYELAGQTDQAISSFDAAVSSRATSWWAEESLYRKAELCSRTGCKEDARRSLEFLRIGFPYSVLMDSVLELKGQVEGTRPEQLESTKTRERQAVARLQELDTKLATPKSDKEALDLATEIVRDYPDTSAAVSALAGKGKALLNMHRYDEARDTYMKLLAIAEPVAPGSVPVHRAKVGMSYTVLKHGQDLFDQVLRRKKDPPADALDKVRADWNLVIRMGSEEKHVARARLMLAKTELLAQRPKEAEAMAEELLAKEYAAPEDLRRLPEQVLAFYLIVSEAARKQGNFDKALEASERIKELYNQLPQETQARLNVRRLLDDAYFQSFVILIHKKADRATIRAEGQKVLARSLDAERADYVRMVIGLPKSKPAP